MQLLVASVRAKRGESAPRRAVGSELVLEWCAGIGWGAPIGVVVIDLISCLPFLLFVSMTSSRGAPPARRLTHLASGLIRLEASQFNMGAPERLILMGRSPGR